jgi:uncharacterized membrane protein (DUF485 family)
MKGWQLLVLTIILFVTAVFLFYVLLPFIAAGPAYIVAAEVPPPDITIAGTVYHLTYQDFADHPVLEELVKKRKRVIRPGSTLNFLLGFFGGPAYSWMPISEEEEHELCARYLTRLEFNRTYFQIAISG